MEANFGNQVEGKSWRSFITSRPFCVISVAIMGLLLLANLICLLIWIGKLSGAGLSELGYVTSSKEYDPFEYQTKKKSAKLDDFTPLVQKGVNCRLRKRTKDEPKKGN